MILLPVFRFVSVTARLHPSRRGDVLAQSGYDAAISEYGSCAAHESATIFIAAVLSIYRRYIVWDGFHHREFAPDVVGDATRRGYLTADNDVSRPFIPSGVSMARDAYPHKKRGIRVHVCFHTAFLVYMSDMLDDIEAVKMLNHMFITG
ncbi:hypothetical protein DL763_003123 [Monosporascus cannonballus]|nr:hypothetical protein DL763_003123 [Monosporascus cannonballus]